MPTSQTKSKAAPFAAAAPVLAVDSTDADEPQEPQATEAHATHPNAAIAIQAISADSSGRACVLTYADLAQISTYLGFNIRTPMELIRQCEKVSGIRADGIDIIFEPGLLIRLKSRCPKGIDFSTFLRDQVKRWAHEYVGW